MTSDREAGLVEELAVDHRNIARSLRRCRVSQPTPTPWWIVALHVWAPRLGPGVLCFIGYVRQIYIYIYIQWDGWTHPIYNLGGPFLRTSEWKKKTPCAKGKLILKNWGLLKLFSIWRGHTHQIWGVHNFMPWPPQNHWVPQKKGCFAATRKTLGKGSRNFGPPMFVGFPRFAQKSCYILTITICISFLVKTLMFDGEIAIFRGELPCPTGEIAAGPSSSRTPCGLHPLEDPELSERTSPSPPPAHGSKPLRCSIVHI